MVYKQEDYQTSVRELRSRAIILRDLRNALTEKIDTEIALVEQMAADILWEKAAPEQIPELREKPAKRKRGRPRKQQEQTTNREAVQISIPGAE